MSPDRFRPLLPSFEQPEQQVGQRTASEASAGSSYATVRWHLHLVLALCAIPCALGHAARPGDDASHYT